MISLLVGSCVKDNIILLHDMVSELPGVGRAIFIWIKERNITTSIRFTDETASYQQFLIGQINGKLSTKVVKDSQKEGMLFTLDLLTSLVKPALPSHCVTDVKSI